MPSDPTTLDAHRDLYYERLAELMSSTYILKGSLERETEKAVQMLVSSINGVPLDEDTTQWFPFSQVSKVVRAGSGNVEDELHVSEWILQQKDML